MGKSWGNVKKNHGNSFGTAHALFRRPKSRRDGRQAQVPARRGSAERMDRSSHRWRGAGDRSERSERFGDGRGVC